MHADAQTESFVSRHRFVLLFCTLLMFFVLVPIMHQVREGLDPALPPLVEASIFVAVLAAAVVSVTKDRPWKIFVLVLGLPAALLGMLHVFVQSEVVAIARHLFGAAFLGYVISVMLAVIFATQRVTFNTVCASLCIYLLLGVVWALAYSVIDLLDSAAFGSSLGDPKPVLRIGLGESTAVLYFSFTTLTTLGYGDIVPASPIARMLACVEAITGQLYLAVLVARLVGMHIVHSLEQEQRRNVSEEEGES